MDAQIQNFVGIDISKLSFDVALLQAQEPENVRHHQFKQTDEGLAVMKEWLHGLGVIMNETTLFCMEYTGIYNTRVLNFLNEQKAQVWVEMAMRIKRSGGFERGSNDKTDAKKIAYYAFRYQDKRNIWTPTNDHLEQIKNLIAQRDRIVDSITQLTVPVNELKEVGNLSAARQLEKFQKSAIKSLETAKAQIETAITKMVEADEKLAHKVNLVKSIKGIGNVTAIALLVYTHGFDSFTSGKELACYCGVVPFVKKQSGTSVRSKPRVSPFANKKLKSLLHLCALSAIRYDEELKAYYERKTKDGKNKMSVINAVRNKLALRINAVLRDNRTYVKNYHTKCA